MHGDLMMVDFAEVWLELLATSENGRTTPIHLSEDSPARYRPHFRVQGGDGELLGVEFIDGPDDPVYPGGRTYATVRFLYEPAVNYDALQVGATFDVVEGPHLVARGRVTRR
jgi:hypothetical protein